MGAWLEMSIGSCCIRRLDSALFAKAAKHCHSFLKGSCCWALSVQQITLGPQHEGSAALYLLWLSNWIATNARQGS